MVTRLPHRVSVCITHTGHRVSCPACGATILLGLGHTTAISLATFHALACRALRLLNRLDTTPCPNCQDLPTDELPDCVVCLGRGWIPRKDN